MKKHIALLLALFMLLSLAACGQEAAPASAADTASAAGEENAAVGESAPVDTPEEAEATPEPEPEEETVLIRREVIVRQIVRGGAVSSEDPVPAGGRTLARYTDYSYDEYGSVTSESNTFRSANEDYPYADGLFRPDGGEWEELDYRYDESGALVEISGPYAPSYSYGICTVVTEMKDGRPLLHTVKLDPNQMRGAEDTVKTFAFAYDAEGRLTSTETVDYFHITKLNGSPAAWPIDPPQRSYFEYDADGHLIRWVDKDSTEYVYDYSEDYSTVLLTVTANGESETREEAVPDESRLRRETETAFIPVRVPLKDLAAFEIGAVEDFYPELPESINGVALPTPDGTRRLISITQEEVLEPPIVTDILYDENGAPCLQLLSFGPILNVRDDQECDEQGRLIRQESSGSVVLLEYSYAEDGRSYTQTRTMTDGGKEETVVLLEEHLVPELVRITAESRYAPFDPVVIYTKEGLPKRITMSFMDYSLSYEAAQEKDGSVRVGLRRSDVEDYLYSMLEYDEHGYLKYYFVPWTGVHVYYAYEDMP